MRPTRLGTLMTITAVACSALAAGPGHSSAPPGNTGAPGNAGPPGAAGEAVRSVEVPVAPRLERGDQGHAVTRPLSPGPFRQVAVTWRGPSAAELEVRTRADGSWSGWRELEPLRDLDAAEGDGTRGSELLWVDDAEKAQVRVRGAAPRDLRLVAIDPGEEPRVEQSPGVVSLRWTIAPRPYVHNRGEWGANESWRNSPPRYSRTIKQVHVHHTASTNRYWRGDVPAIIRGMYLYHTHSLGWSDLGYNFLVDKWGRLWEGRAGGVRKPVRGAHTLGFNHNSVGVAVIGSFGRLRPSDDSVRKVVRLAAWKLDKHGRRPAGTVLMTSSGSDRFPKGRIVKLHVIDGHRDTNHTACPGRHLYDRLPAIRRAAQARADKW